MYIIFYVHLVVIIMSLSTSPDPEDEDVDDSSSRGGVNVVSSVCESFYVAKGNDKRVLICLCYGLKDEIGLPLIDTNRDPWVSQAKDVRKPKLSDHIKPEILRRSMTISCIASPRPGQWKHDKCMEWLLSNPVDDSESIAFLSQEAKRVTNILSAALKEKDSEAAVVSKLGAWAGPKPYLRLVHCIIHDEIKTHYLTRDAVLSRIQLDDRNSDSRPPTAYERVAKKWNDPTFNPTTSVSTCHPDFLSPIDIGYDTVCQLRPANAVDIKDRLTDIRARLIRMIKKWERSGQGDGSRNDVDDDEREGDTAPTVDTEDLTSFQLGKLEGRTQFALDSRQCFLNDGAHGKISSWYLYFWEQADAHDLLATTVTELTSAVGAADANNVPSTITAFGGSSVADSSNRVKRKYTFRNRTPKRKNRGGGERDNNDDDDSESSGGNANADHLVSALFNLGNESKMARLAQDLRSYSTRSAELKKLIHENRVALMETMSIEKKEMYNDFIKEYKDELEEVKQQMEETSKALKKLEDKLDDE